MAAVPRDELGVQAGWGSDDPETLAMAAERRDVLRAAFDALDQEAREVLTLRDLEGLSGEVTAALLGVSLAATKSRLHRARMSLAALAARIDTHVARCVRCAKFGSEFAALLTAMRRHLGPPDAAPADVLARVRAAIPY
jgi:predicted DNA-binding protein (UPF0251 family)